MNNLDKKEQTTLERIFPDYFERFELPEGARSESIKVYRACKSGKCDRNSFLPTYEENGFAVDDGADETDPGQYSLSTYEKPTHVKRFAGVMYDIKEPCRIAAGLTNPIHGLVQRTRERKRCKSSHVDWWLYKDAAPYREFEIINDFDSYLADYIRERDGGK